MSKILDVITQVKYFFTLNVKEYRNDIQIYHKFLHSCPSDTKFKYLFAQDNLLATISVACTLFKIQHTLSVSENADQNKNKFDEYIEWLRIHAHYNLSKFLSNPNNYITSRTKCRCMIDKLFHKKHATNVKAIPFHEVY